jgi:hypothetical protein
MSPRVLSFVMLAGAYSMLVGACERSASFGNVDTAGSGSASVTERVAPGGSAVAAKPTAPVAPVAPADPGFGSVAFKTYRYGGTAVQFTTASKVETWWQNMAGNTVHGTYEQNGAEIVVHWDPKATNNGWSQERYHQMGPCSMARYDGIDRKTGKTKEDTWIYQQREPRCDTVRVAK